MVAAPELLPPVEYSPTLLLAAVGLPLLVLVYYAAATWLTRPPRRTPPPEPDVADARSAALARLDEIERSTRTGAMTLRAAHQAISEVVREYVATLDRGTPADARVLTLDQLRERYADTGGSLTGPVDVVALVYPPEFEPGDQGRPSERLAPALRDARELVGRWQP